MKKIFNLTIDGIATVITFEEIAIRIDGEAGEQYGILKHEARDTYHDGDEISTYYLDLPEDEEEAMEMATDPNNWTSYYHIDEDSEDEIFIID